MWNSTYGSVGFDYLRIRSSHIELAVEPEDSVFQTKVYITLRLGMVSSMIRGLAITLEEFIRLLAVIYQSEYH